MMNQRKHSEDEIQLLRHLGGEIHSGDEMYLEWHLGGEIRLEDEI